MLISFFRFKTPVSVVHRCMLLTSVFFLICLPLAKSLAQGDLLITPKRIVFEGNKRSQEINLSNSGRDTAKYVVSIVQIRMKEDGSFERIIEPDQGQNFADKNLRFYPRTVLLAPNEAQTIKIETVNSRRLAPGEYRSHIYFRAEPREKPLGDEVQTDTTFAVRLTPIYGITIPVIIRVGANDAKVSVSDFSFAAKNDTAYNVKFVLNRSGNMSVYGDIKLYYVSPEGTSTQVGLIGGLAVYTPGLTRRCNFDLVNSSGVKIASGKLRLEYVPSSDAKKGIMAEAEIPLR